MNMPAAEKKAILVIFERLLLVWLLMIALGLGALRLGLSPLLESEQAVKWAVKNATGDDISFSSSSVSWRGWKPWLSSEDVRLGGLYLEKLELELDPFASISRGELVFARFSLHGADLLIEQTDQGWQVSNSRDQATSQEKTLFPYAEKQAHAKPELATIVSELAKLSGKDFQHLQKLRQLEELDISSSRVEVRLQNNHTLVFDDLFFNAQAEHQDYQIMFTGSWLGADWQAQLELTEQGGRGFIHLPENLPRQLSHFLDQSFELSGRLQNGLWLEWDESGEATLLADLSLQSPAMTDGQRALLLEQLQARLQLSLNGQQFMLRMPLLSWRDATHQGQLVDLAVDLNSSGAIKGTLNQITLNGLEILSNVPGMPQQAQHWLNEGFPAGDIRNIEVDVTAAGDFYLKAGFDEVSLRSVDGIPGFENLTGSLLFNSEALLFQLDSQQLRLLTGDLFRWPLPAEYASGLIGWLPEENGWQLRATDLQLKTPHVQLAGEVFMEDRPGRPLWSSWLFSLEKGRANQVGLYLPSGIMGRGLVRFLDRSILDGELTSAGVIVQGPLADFPWHQKTDGLFEVRANALHGEFEFLPQWPVLHDVSAQLVFRGNGMDIRATHAYLDAGATADRGRVWIDNFAEPNLKLNVDLDAKGPVSAGVQYIRTSPLNSILGEVFDQLRVSGDLGLGLKLAVGLEEEDYLQIIGDLEVANASLGVVGQPWDLTDTSGKMRFTERDFNATGLKTHLFGKPAQLTIDYRDEAAQVLLNSSFEMKDLPTLVPQLDFLAKIPGEAKFSASYIIDSEKQQLDIFSDTLGVELPFTYPVNKPANEAAALKVRYYPDRQQVEVDLEDRLEVIWRERKEKQEGILAIGDIHLDPLQLPDGEMHLLLKTDRLDAIEVADNLEWLFGGNISQEPAADAVYASYNRRADDELIQLDHFLTDTTRTALEQFSVLDLQVDNLAVADFHFSNTQAVLKGVPYNWLLTLGSEQIAGEISKNPLTPYQVNLEKVHMVTADEQSVGQTRRDDVADEGVEEKVWYEQVASGSLPDIRLSCQDCTIGERALGKVSFSMRSSQTENLIEDLLIQNPYLKISGKAFWLHDSVEDSTQINVTLDSRDTGKALQSLGITDGLDADIGKGKLLAYWQGAPWQFEYQKLNGTLRFDVGAGRIRELTNSQAAGRLVSLINLKALLRRLRFDFSDLYKDGFSFDRMDGNFVIKNGNAYTQNTTIDGPVAKIRLMGRTGLAAQDYDQVIKVIPPAGNSLAFIAALALNPATGLYLWFGNQILDKPLERVTEFDYRLYGSWDDPQLEPLSVRDVDEEDHPGGQNK